MRVRMQGLNQEGIVITEAANIPTDMRLGERVRNMLYIDNVKAIRIGKER
jgi:hypothetical protein